MQRISICCLAWLLLPSAALAAALFTERIPTLQTPVNSPNSTKVPGESPAYYCSDPIDDVFKIRRLDFVPTNPRIGFPLTIRFIGEFLSSTGLTPWLNITGSINGRPEREALYYSPLCDIDVFQEIIVQSPAGDYDKAPRLHRSCPPSAREGYAVVSSPPMPLTPQTAVEGRYELRAEAMTQDGRRIFCVGGSFDVTT